MSAPAIHRFTAIDMWRVTSRVIIIIIIIACRKTLAQPMYAFIFTFFVAKTYTQDDNKMFGTFDCVIQAMQLEFISQDKYRVHDELSDRQTRGHFGIGHACGRCMVRHARLACTLVDESEKMHSFSKTSMPLWCPTAPDPRQPKIPCIATRCTIVTNN